MTSTETALEVPGSAYTPARIALVKATVAQDTSDDELAMFLSVAQSRDLDPFTGEIHAIVRGKGDRRKMTIQTGIGGYRKIADRTGLVEWVGEQEFTGDGLAWTAAWVDDEPPVAARFTIKRKDRTKPETRTVLWAEYVQRKYDGAVTSMWQEKPCTMLGKVAEATALRSAFPNHLNGLYVDEEMHQADAVDVVEVTAAAMHPTLDDHLAGFDRAFLETVDLDAARAHAAKGQAQLRQTLKVLTDRQTAWADDGDDDADGDGVGHDEEVEQADADDETELADHYALLTVPDVEALLDSGAVKIEGHYGDPVVLDLPYLGDALVRELETHRKGGPRKGVVAALDAHDVGNRVAASTADLDAPSDDDTPPSSDETGDPSTSRPPDDDGAYTSTEGVAELLEEFAAAIVVLDDQHAKPLRARLGALIAAADDGVPDRDTLAGLVRHTTRLAGS